MRDDIHKSAPVNREWRKFLRHCVREADRQCRAPESGHTALLGDCARELPPQLIEELKGRCTSPKLDLFEHNLDGIRSSGQTNSVMAQQLVERMQQRAQNEDLNLETLKDELSCVIEERLNSQRRAIRGHVLKSGGSGVSDCSRAVTETLSQIPVSAIAQGIVESDGKVAKLVGQNMAVSLDEDLRT